MPDSYQTVSNLFVFNLLHFVAVSMHFLQFAYNIIFLEKGYECNLNGPLDIGTFGNFMTQVFESLW